MKISTKGRYGLRLMIDLAMRYGKGPILLKDIAARQDISEKYLWQLISNLMSAGLVVSKRGVHGGYSLAISPDQINIYDIVSILEGDLSLIDCTVNNNACERIEDCLAKELWTELSIKIKDVLSSYTLQDLIKKYLNDTGLFSYNI